jgi:uncharacterized membrane protein YkvA (DUF1232 family)
MEAIPGEQALAQDQNGAITSAKSDALTEKLRTGMAALVVDAIFLYRLLRHPDTRWYARGLLFLPVIYLCSPIQLIPNLIPVLGQMDDVFVIWITKKVARYLVDEKAWQECHSEAVASRLPFLKQIIKCREKTNFKPSRFTKHLTFNHQRRRANGTI